MFFFIGFIIVLVIFFVRYQRSKINMAQSVKPPILSFGSSPVTFSPGQPFELLIQLDPQDNDIRSFDIVIQYDDRKIFFQNPEDISSYISSSYQLLKGTTTTYIDTAHKTIRIVGVNTKGKFASLVVIARIVGVVARDVPAGSYPLFMWDTSQTKLGDYVRVREIAMVEKVFTVKM